MAVKTKSVAVTARIPGDIYRLMEEAAEEKRTTITGVIIDALAEYLENVCDVCGQSVPPSRAKSR